MANFWLKPSGTNLITLQEQITTTVELPLSQPSATVSLISGELPSGLRLENNQLVGTPREVSRETVSTFVLRASYNNAIEDRTYSITTLGADAPEWVTEPDLLPAGNNNAFYILDSAPIDFQLEVDDPDLEAGQNLEFFIGSKGGVLPPGIELTADGRLVGVVDPILAIEKSAGRGFYDEVGYDLDDKVGYDWSIRPSNGLDSFFYDTTTYDFNLDTKSPKKLNRYYQFTVTVTDGETAVNRTFRLFVVGDDFFRADTSIMQVGTNIFTADNTHVRVPIWLTPSNLGFRRANNYVTLVLDVIDPNTLVGLVTYYLAPTNDDGSVSLLPPGMSLDTTTGEVAGVVPYQPAVTKEYKFTVVAQRTSYDTEVVELQKFAFETAPIGANQIKINKFDADLKERAIGRSFTLNEESYEVITVNSANSAFDIITINKTLRANIFKGAEINLGFVTKEFAPDEISSSSKTFTLNLLGEVDSTIKWLTPSNFGDFPANYISTLSVKAETTVPNANLLYTLESGTLPPGLRLSLNGEIIGKVRSFGDEGNRGLTVFDNQNLKFDGNETRFDRTYKFTIKAQDQFKFSAIEREFTVTLSDPDDKQYSNVYLAPLLKQNQRDEYKQFINNAEIFLPEYLYRPNDPNFGLQTNLRMLAYSGIETKLVEQYVAAAAKYMKRKKFRIGEVKTARALNPGTREVVYELVYLDIKDVSDDNIANLETRKKFKTKNTERLTVNSARYSQQDETYDSERSKLKVLTRELGLRTTEFINVLPIYTRAQPVNIPITNNLRVEKRNQEGADVPFEVGVVASRKLRPVPENTVTVDNDLYTTDQLFKDVVTISNMQNFRERLSQVGETEKNFLPLWMRSQQENDVGELGYKTAIVLCYCQPDTSKIIANSIKLNNIQFLQYELDVDRLVIDATEGNSNEQYIVFQNREYNV